MIIIKSPFPFYELARYLEILNLQLSGKDEGEDWELTKARG